MNGVMMNTSLTKPQRDWLNEYCNKLCLLNNLTSTNRVYKKVYSDGMIRDNTTIANLYALWKQETEGYSSISKKINNKHYLKICESSPFVTVPLLLREMQAEPDHWFVALKHLTETDPTQKYSKDCSFEEATQVWIE